MVTSLSGSNSSFSLSAQYFSNNADGTKGFTDVRACVTIDGYGYNGRVAQACDMGFYNSKNNYEACKPCPYGLTTEGVGKGYTLASCGIAKGFGYSSAANGSVPCPIGKFIHRICPLLLPGPVVAAFFFVCRNICSSESCTQSLSSP